MDEQDRIWIANNFKTIELNEKQLEYNDQSLLKANKEFKSLILPMKLTQTLNKLKNYDKN